MSFRPIFRQWTVAPVAATLLAGGIATYPRRTVFAEAPQETKKPIYDDYPVERTLQSRDRDTPSALFSSPPSSPAPTDVLAAHIRQVRLFLYAHSLAAENSFNTFLSRVLRVENAFTDTIASLAPSAESGERLLPGSIYVIVSAMAGSIVSRNRGVVLRTTAPVAFGTIAAWTLLPVTMRNVSSLMWKYEKNVPVIAEQHLRIWNSIEHTLTTSVAHSQMAKAMLEEKVSQGREKLRELIRKGR